MTSLTRIDGPLVTDDLGGGVTTTILPDLIMYQLDGEDIAAIGRRDQMVDVLGANDLDAVALLRLIRGLMFAAERLLQMEYARRAPADVSTVPTKGT